MEKKQTSSYALRIVPLILFILALAILCFEYERRLSFQTASHLNSVETITELKREINDLNYVLKMLGGSECAMRLKGVKSQVDSLTSNLEDAYTDVAYCDDMDEKMMGLHMEILELENELGPL